MKPNNCLIKQKIRKKKLFLILATVIVHNKYIQLGIAGATFDRLLIIIVT